MSYKPPEEHINSIEQLDFDSMTKEELNKKLDDVNWCLQTKSYRDYYLERLENLSDILCEHINKI